MSILEAPGLCSYEASILNHNLAFDMVYLIIHGNLLEATLRSQVVFVHLDFDQEKRSAERHASATRRTKRLPVVVWVQANKSELACPVFLVTHDCEHQAQTCGSQLVRLSNLRGLGACVAYNLPATSNLERTPVFKVLHGSDNWPLIKRLPVPHSCILWTLLPNPLSKLHYDSS